MVPLVPHKFEVLDRGFFESIHIHANDRFVTEWLERGRYASRVISTVTNSFDPNGPAYTPRSGATSL